MSATIRPAEGLSTGADGLFKVIFSPFAGMSWVIDRLKHLDDSVPEKCPDGRIDLQAIASRVYSSVALFHTKVLKYGSQWSEGAGNVVNSLVMKCLIPLSCCMIGRCIQENISKALANITRVVIFSAIQIFHVAPYVLAAAVIGGSILLFYSSPAALITCFLGTILMIQVLLTYQLIETVRWTNFHGQHISDTVVAVFAPLVSAVTFAANHPFLTTATTVASLYAYNRFVPSDGLIRLVGDFVWSYFE